jgi:hypothetical protein
MSEALPFLVIGLLLIVLVIFLLGRSRATDQALSEPAKNEEALTALQTEPVPQELLERIFGAEDWDYICVHEPESIQRLFQDERKRLAISWLRRMRRQVRTLLRFHKVHAAKAAGLEPLSEIKLAFDYCLFQLFCGLLIGLIWLRGPTHARRLVGLASGFSDRLLSLAFAILAAEQPAEGANNFRPRLTNG